MDHRPRPTNPGPRRRGAPKGNLNALKHGRRSRQYQALLQALLDEPMTRAILMRFADTAARGADIARDARLQTIRENARETPVSDSAAGIKNRKSTKNSESG